MIADLGAGISKINVPTIILVGDEDGVERASTLPNVFSRAIPHAELRVILNVGHLSPVGAPAHIAQACVDMLTLLDE